MDATVSLTHCAAAATTTRSVHTFISTFAQSSSSYLTPFSKKQHSLLLTFSLTQEANVQRWKDGEREKCLEALTALSARVWTSRDSPSASSILEATWGGYGGQIRLRLRAECMTERAEPLQSELWVLAHPQHCISDVRAEPTAETWLKLPTYWTKSSEEHNLDRQITASVRLDYLHADAEFIQETGI